MHLVDARNPEFILWQFEKRKFRDAKYFTQIPQVDPLPSQHILDSRNETLRFRKKEGTPFWFRTYQNYPTIRFVLDSIYEARRQLPRTYDDSKCNFDIPYIDSHQMSDASSSIFAIAFEKLMALL